MSSSEVDPEDDLGGVTVFGIGLALKHDKTVSVAVPHSGKNLDELDWQSLQLLHEPSLRNGVSFQYLQLSYPRRPPLISF